MRHKAPSVTTDRYAVRLGAKGRLVLPSALRRRLGVREGDRIILSTDATGSVHVTSRRDQAQSLLGVLSHVVPDRTLAEELIAERREEARKEASS